MRNKFKKGHTPWNKGKKTGIKPTNAFKKGNHPNTEFLKGYIPWNKDKKGYKLKDTSKMKGNINGFKNGEKNPAWLGGKSFGAYNINWTKTLKISIRERDNYICKMCGKQQENYALDVHHIDYDKKNCNPKNLITLCRKCHSKTNFNRDYYKKLLTK